MSDGFSWDKVLGQSDGEATPPPPAESHALPEDIAKLLQQIDEKDESATTPADPGTAPVQSESALTPQEAPKGVEPGGFASGGAVPEPVETPPSTSLTVTGQAPDEPVTESNPHVQTHYVPEYIPKELRDSVSKQVSKYYVDEQIQEPGIVRTGEDALPLKEVHIDELLRAGVERKASDIHLTAGLPPMARIDGEIMPLPYEVCEVEHTRRLSYEILSDDNLQKFEQTHELDFAYTVAGVARFRVNVYMQRGSVAVAARMIPNRIPSYDDLRLPTVIREIAKRSSGLILVTGPTGSGKSTTIASMIDDINETRSGHIVTIEDPIEYLHRHKRCMVNQRELHSDTYSLHNALRAVLREDPDIILVGELRDLETIEAALTLAETGHLVFGTLHTRNAPASIDRVVDVFPSDQQEQIRVLLANTIEGIISQQLLPKLGGGRVAAIEIMTGIPAIKNLIREGKTHQMYSIIETNRQVGMQTMDSHLAELFRLGFVSYEECLMRSVDKETFARLAKSAA
ncbi:MAG: PilT/PilU family type 4a pilus ATPase [Fimbriimonadaceae bacterium]|nr:PilT/PilU family type 4a pilus ATPase [Nitrospira sp.]MCW5939572.1 PilT/PilU family type 4a pilus ATPase [Fimbriimonadaceae bacterium]QYK58752.1 MAG: PilT/PilU family type 4a pilus ATPase [Fimbriimonadaceae bacterium]